MYGWGTTSEKWFDPKQKMNQYTGKYLVPKDSGIQRFYNVGCTGQSTVASADNGVYGFGNFRGRYYNYEKTEVYKLSNLKPDNIKMIFCSIRDFNIVQHIGPILSSDGTEDNINLSSIELPVTFNSFPLDWTIESHKFFPTSFKKRVFAFLLFWKRYNNKNNKQKFPKVMITYIIKFFSLY